MENRMKENTREFIKSLNADKKDFDASILSEVKTDSDNRMMSPLYEKEQLETIEKIRQIAIGN